LKLNNNDKVEKLAVNIQQKLEGGPAILVGSGGSIPYGLPSMKDLALKIVDQLQETYRNEDDWKAFVAELESNDNLESALEKITLKEDIHNAIIQTVWEFINKKDKDAFLEFINKGNYPALTLILRKFIQRAGSTNVITTNYDRLVEYSIDFAQGKAETGFYGDYFKTFRTVNEGATKRTVNVFKVHGSVDWFRHNSNQNIMSTSFLESGDLIDTYIPLVVTPGNGKYKETHNDPYRTVIAEADKALRSSPSYLCLGYGFNDEHIQPIIIDENRNKNKPLVIVTKSITQKMEELFIRNGNGNCLIISENGSSGTIVHYNKLETELFDENYWEIENFYKLWFE